MKFHTPYGFFFHYKPGRANLFNMGIELKGRFVSPKSEITARITTALRTTTDLGRGEGASIHFFIFIPNPLEYTDPDGRTLNSDGTVEYDTDIHNTLDKMAKAAGWDDWREALQGNNQGAIFRRGTDEVTAAEVSTWYDDEGNWNGSGDLDGLIISNKNPVFSRPTTGIVSSPFGPRINPVTGMMGTHGGVDIANSAGTFVNSAAFGVVDDITRGDAVWGNTVVVRHGSGYTTRYAHLATITNWTNGEGTVLHRNTRIGTMGSTGQSTGPHLHYGLYRNGTAINPNIQ